MPEELGKERMERRLIVLLFVGTMMLMLGLTYLTHLSMRDHARLTVELRFLNTLALELEDVRSRLVDQETGARGFLLTNDSTYLQPYLLAMATREKEEEELRVLAQGSRFEASVDSLLRQTARATDMHRLLVRSQQRAYYGRRAEKERLELGRGTMDDARALFRGIMDDIARERERLLAPGMNKGTSPRLLVSMLLLTILVTAWLVWRLSHALRRTEQVKFMLRSKVRALDDEVNAHRAVQDLLQQVLDTSPAGIMTLSAVRDGQGAVIDMEWTMANQSACAILEHEELVGHRLLDLFPDDLTTGLFDEFRHVVETGRVARGEMHHLGGTVDKWLMTDRAKLEDGLLVVFTDITEQRFLQQVAKDQERHELIGQITRTLAHEVRNPLTNIHLALEQLQDDMADDPAAAGLLEIMQRNLGRIGGLVKEMLESTRRHDVALENHALIDLVRAAAATVRDRAGLRGVDVQVVEEATAQTVMADKGPCVLAITNILVNAIEAIDSGPGLVELRIKREQGRPVLMITDNGRGMDAEDLGKLFTPFFSKRTGGLGMGLVTTRSILDAHGVGIDVSSAQGRGTTFTMHFPAPAR